MSHIDSSALSQYNSLMDPHLNGYFNNTRMRRHLKQSGMIDKRGEIVSENTYRLNMARKEHKTHVRDLLAQAIVHKTLDIERNRQVDIRKKLEEIAKCELVRRVRLDRGRKGDEEILPYLTPRGRGSRPSSAYTPGGPARTAARPKSAPAARSRGRKRSKSPGSDRVIAVDEDGIPLTPRDSASSVTSDSTIGDGRGKKGKKSKYPKGEIDDRHLYALDQHTLREYKMAQYNVQYGRGPSPFLWPQPGLPAPPKTGSARSPRGRRRIMHTDSQGRPLKRPQNNSGSLLLHRQEPAMKHQSQLQTGCQMTIHYFGSNLRLDHEQFDPRDHICVEQQHCGGNTLYVFREKVLPGSDFTFESRRHRGFPFGLTFYVNGVENCRLSACCEYKHSKGAKLGGKLGHFGIVGVSGSNPCYKCQIADELKKGEKKSKQSGRKNKTQQSETGRSQTVDVTGRKKKKSKRGEDTNRSDHTVTGVSDDEAEEDKRKSDKSVTVAVSDEETARNATDATYDDDFDDEGTDRKTATSRSTTSRTATSRTATSRSRSSSSSSRSRSRSRSRSSSRSRSRSHSPSSGSARSYTDNADDRVDSPVPIPDYPATDDTIPDDATVTSQSEPKVSNEHDSSSDEKQKEPSVIETSEDSDAHGRSSPKGLSVDTRRSPEGRTSPELEKKKDSKYVTSESEHFATSESEHFATSESEGEDDKPRKTSPRDATTSPSEFTSSTRERTPSPVERIVTPRERTPSPKPRTPSPRQRTPSPKQRTPSPQEMKSSVSERTSSSSSSSASSTTRERTPSPKARAPSPVERTITPTPAEPVPAASVYRGPRDAHDGLVAETRVEQSTAANAAVDDPPVSYLPPREMSSDEEEDRLAQIKHTTAQVHHTDEQRKTPSPTGVIYKTPTPPRSPKPSSPSASRSTPSPTELRNKSPSPREKTPSPVLAGAADVSLAESVKTETSTTQGSTAEKPVDAGKPRSGLVRSSSSSSSDSSSDSGSSSDSSSDSESEDETPRRPISRQQSTKVESTDESFSPPGTYTNEDPVKVEVHAGDTIRPMVENKRDVDIENSTLTSAQVDELGEIVKENGSVHSLTLRTAGLTDAHVEKLADALENTSPVSDLRVLNLNLNLITEAGVPALLRIVSTKTDLKKLYLHGNRLGDAGVEALLNGLLKLHMFRLSDEEKVSAEQLKAIRGAAHSVVEDVMKDVLHNSSLNSVESQNSGDSQTRRTLDRRNSISGGLSLTTLDIGDCDIGAAGAKKVAQLLESSMHLQNLILSGSRDLVSTPEILTEIALAMSDNKSVTSLSLDYCSLGNAGIKALAECLKYNTTLKELDLEGNRVDDEGAQSLLEMLEMNKTITSIEILQGNNISDTNLERISTALSSRV